MEKGKKDESLGYTIAYTWLGCIFFMLAMYALMVSHLLAGWPSLKFVIKGFVLACILNTPTIVISLLCLIIFFGYYIAQPYEIVDAFSRWRISLSDWWHDC